MATRALARAASPAVVSVRVTAKDYGLPRPKSLAALKSSGRLYCLGSRTAAADVHRRRTLVQRRTAAPCDQDVEPVGDRSTLPAGRRDQAVSLPSRIGHVHDLADAGHVDEELLANRGRVEDEIGMLAGRRRPRVVGLDRAVETQSAQPRSEGMRLLGRARGDPEGGTACIEERGCNGLRRAGAGTPPRPRPRPRPRR